MCSFPSCSLALHHWWKIRTLTRRRKKNEHSKLILPNLHPPLSFFSFSVSLFSLLFCVRGRHTCGHPLTTQHTRLTPTSTLPRQKQGVQQYTHTRLLPSFCPVPTHGPTKQKRGLACLTHAHKKQNQQKAPLQTIDVATKSKSLEKDIDTLFKDLHSLLDDKKAALLAEIQKITKNQVTKATTLQNTLREHMETLKTGKKACLKALTFTSISEFADNLGTSSSGEKTKDEGIEDVPKYTKELLAKCVVENVDLTKTALDIVDIRSNHKKWVATVKVLFTFFLFFFLFLFFCSFNALFVF